VFKCSGVQVFRCSGVQVFRCSCVLVFVCSCVRVFVCFCNCNPQSAIRNPQSEIRNFILCPAFGGLGYARPPILFLLFLLVPPLPCLLVQFMSVVKDPQSVIYNPQSAIRNFIPSSLLRRPSSFLERPLSCLYWSRLVSASLDHPRSTTPARPPPLDHHCSSLVPP